MANRKIVTATRIVVLTGVAGYFLSGYLVLLLKLDMRLFGLHTYYEYVHAIGLPQVAPYVGKIKWAGYLGFGLPGLLCLLTLVLMFKPRKQALHGDARFAGAADLPSTACSSRAATASWSANSAAGWCA
ncbi:hypothetical membrane protein [Xanthomonas translucens pv. translucens DSM 18974]|uniref:Hypothetical membrane protein n=1 Tax=Xanthomonas translucens pv. translucens DSM 18974 TaxID=1261556 RepID=A0A1C3TM71_XANCT|nr:type IV secretion system protein VirD4 [Xanthomonas translucens pv. translucens DSM 18974]SCB04331.1 hypothetical membrane protein [Xanthomonas translucens pv. translucens DSM 18974]